MVQCFTLPFHSTDIRLSRSDWDSDSCLLLWPVAMAVSRSRVAHAVLVTGQQYAGYTMEKRLREEKVR